MFQEGRIVFAFFKGLSSVLKVHWSPGEEWQPQLIDLNVKSCGFLHKVGTLPTWSFTDSRVKRAWESARLYHWNGAVNHMSKVALHLWAGCWQREELIWNYSWRQGVLVDKVLSRSQKVQMFSPCSSHFAPVTHEPLLSRCHFKYLNCESDRNPRFSPSLSSRLSCFSSVISHKGDTMENISVH